MAPQPLTEPSELLLAAAGTLHPIPGDLELWSYGWADETYRRSPDAALPGPSGLQGLTPEGVHALEDAVNQLLHDSRIADRWDDEELWGVVASLVAALPRNANPSTYVRAGVRDLRTAGPSLVVVPIANVIWDGPPCELGNGVIGLLNDDLSDMVRMHANGRPTLDSEQATEWIGDLRDTASVQDGSRPGSEIILAAHWTTGISQRAIRYAERWVDEVCDLALLFSGDPTPQALVSLRGMQNRPGVRGIRFHRPAIDAFLTGQPGGTFELVSKPLAITERFGYQPALEWLSSEPVPLHELLARGVQHDRVQWALTHTESIPKRLRVAARWYAEAHWADSSDDAMLALGVAVDALIGARAGLPGRVMAQRYAHLDDQLANRRDRLARYNDVYSVRSAVAHGGAPSKLDAHYVRSVAVDVRWLAERLVALHDRFGITDEGSLDSVFESLSLGLAGW